MISRITPRRTRLVRKVIRILLLAQSYLRLCEMSSVAHIPSQLVTCLAKLQTSLGVAHPMAHTARFVHRLGDRCRCSSFVQTAHHKAGGIAFVAFPHRVGNKFTRPALAPAARATCMSHMRTIMVDRLAVARTPSLVLFIVAAPGFASCHRPVVHGSYSADFQ